MAAANRLGSIFWLAVSGLSFVTTASAAPDRGRPNVVVLLNDDQGWGDMGCAGHPFLKTPNLDRLAADGCLLTDFYATAPVCSPSRAGFLTGRIQNRFGLHHLINDGAKRNLPLFTHVPGDEPTLARLLRSAGYATGHIGKWHVSHHALEGTPSMDEYGFDFHMLLGAGRHVSYRNSTWTKAGEKIQTVDRWSADVYVDEAIDFIKRAEGRPFYVNIWSFAPHAEVEASEPFRKIYGSHTEEEQHYFGAITQMDAAYGRLFAFLDQTGLAENTIIFFSSDNGCEPHLIPWTERARGSTGGLRGGKHALHEGGIRVPAILVWPGVTRPGSVLRSPAWMPDIVASICAAVGVAPPSGFAFDGVDLRPALAGGELTREQPLYWQSPWRGVGLRDGTESSSPPLALRDGRWKILCQEDFTEVELYDLSLDRAESWNKKDQYRDVAQLMLAKLKLMYAEVNGARSREAGFVSHALRLPEGLDKNDYPVHRAVSIKEGQR